MSEFKWRALQNQISADPEGADLKLSLFISSLFYKFNSCCVPFPPKFLLPECGSKDIDGLNGLVKRIPPLSRITEDIMTVDPDVLSLLYWLLVEVKGPRLESIAKADFHTVLELVEQDGPVVPPTHIFRVTYREDSTSEAKFQEFKEEFGTSYGFHGSKIFNFHSILHHGLQQHLNKNALFGEGLYFSSELNVSLPYSSNGSGWKNSIIGTTLSCVALCEFINHPVSVKRCTKEAKKSTDLPEKYIVITNNEVVRTRYLLIYASGGKSRSPDTISALVLNQKFLAAFYFLILVIIGFSDSRYVQYLKHLLSRKLSAGVEAVRILFGK